MAGFRPKFAFLHLVHKLRYILQSLETKGICKYTDYRIMSKDLSD